MIVYKSKIARYIELNSIKIKNYNVQPKNFFLVPCPEVDQGPATHGIAGAKFGSSGAAIGSTYAGFPGPEVDQSFLTQI